MRCLLPRHSAPAGAGAARLGQGGTGRPYLADQGGCDEADYLRAARVIAAQISFALGYLRDQPFIRRDHVIVIGHSAGGWDALALAGEQPERISAIIAFAPGRANDFPNQVCDDGTSSREESASDGIKMTNWPDDDVILYDGVCILCSRWVRFVVARDTDRRFRFAPVQSDYGARLARAVGIDPADPDTNAVVHGGVAYFKSDAALTVLSHLPGWRWTRALFAAPKPLRDSVYNLVARNRYRIFGKYETCFVPDAAMRERVLE